jgi:hypothetical protein
MRGRRAVARLTSGQRPVKSLGARPGAESQINDPRVAFLKGRIQSDDL